MRPHREHGRGSDSAALAEAQVVGRRSAKASMPTGGERLVHPGFELAARTPKLAGPKATSSCTVGMNSWSSGSWKTMPTRWRISRRFGFVTGEPAHLHLAGPAAEDAVEVEDERASCRRRSARGARPARPRRCVRSTPNERLWPSG